MNRRGFLRLLGIASAGVAIGVDPITRIFASPESKAFLVTPDALLRPLPHLGEFTPGERYAFGFTQLDELARMVLRSTVDRLDPHHRLYLDPRAHRVGDAVAVRASLPKFDPNDLDGDVTLTMQAVTLDQQYAVQCALARSEFREITAHELDMAFAKPIGAQLAHQIMHRGLTTFGVLPLVSIGDGAESVIVTDKHHGLAIRGIRCHDKYRAVDEIRFDILGGRA